MTKSKKIEYVDRGRKVSATVHVSGNVAFPDRAWAEAHARGDTPTVLTMLRGRIGELRAGGVIR